MSCLRLATCSAGVAVDAETAIECHFLETLALRGLEGVLIPALFSSAPLGLQLRSQFQSTLDNIRALHIELEPGLLHPHWFLFASISFPKLRHLSLRFRG